MNTNILKIQAVTTATKRKQPAFFLKKLLRPKFETIQTLRKINFSLQSGDTVGLAADEASSRDALLGLITGTMKPESGSISFTDFTPDSLHCRSLRNDQVEAWPNLSINHIVNLEVKKHRLDKKKTDQIVKEVARSLEIIKLLDRPIRKLRPEGRFLSKLLIAVITSPKIIILDSEISDTTTLNKAISFLENYMQKHAAAVILINDNAEVLSRFSNRVLVIADKEIKFQGPIQQLLRKYITHKSVFVEFEREVDKDKLQQFGEINKYSGSTVEIRMPTAETGAKTAEIIQQLPVRNIETLEPSTAQIIEMVAKHKQESKIEKQRNDAIPTQQVALIEN